MVKISVIIPAHQEEKYIEDTLKALDNKDAEIIVVANGCTDKTAEIAKKYAKVIEVEERGVSKARNLGAKEAKGEKYVFLDADIHVGKDTIDKILDSEYNIGTCYARPDVDKIIPKTLMQLKKPFQHIGWSSGLIFCSNELYDNVGGFDETMDFGEDGKFIRKARKLGKYGVVKSHVINSMRRFEKEGYLRWIFFWIKNLFKSGEKKYTVVR